MHSEAAQDLQSSWVFEGRQKLLQRLCADSPVLACKGLQDVPPSPSSCRLTGATLGNGCVGQAQGEETVGCGSSCSARKHFIRKSMGLSQAPFKTLFSESEWSPVLDHAWGAVCMGRTAGCRILHADHKQWANVKGMQGEQCHETLQRGFCGHTVPRSLKTWSFQDIYVSA